MELTLTHETETVIGVTCNGQHSHTFDLRMLISNQEIELSQPIDDSIAYGNRAYLALFPSGTLARHTLETMPERILLVATDNDLDAIPWEYAYGPDGFLILGCHFVRGLPAAQRIAPPTLDSGLHIVAVPSNPLSTHVAPLNIDAEWMRLKETIESLPSALILERTHPPTMEQVRNAVAGQHHRIVHFMGHGGQVEDGAVLCFEKDNGDLDLVSTKLFALRIRGTVFLVTLNACVSAAPGQTPFSNLAAALVRQRIPYALGMRLSIPDEDACSFSRAFYNDLARGTSIEEALLQARLTLAKSSRPWVVGVPVLYTSLTAPAAGFIHKEGRPTIIEHLPTMEVSSLPRAEGAFQGRMDDLKHLGTLLTGDSRPRILTIHGSGGQGKTALAREAVERFAYAWPGGIWARSLENLPSREIFVNELAQFLDIPTREIADPAEVERRLLTRLPQRRTLIVLDNTETFVDAVDAKNTEAIRLGQFIQQLSGLSVSLLVTSRIPLGWSGEELLEMGGLSPKEGVDLFLQCAPRRRYEIEQTSAWDLIEKLEGHPLGLRLLAAAFDISHTPFPDFIHEYDQHLLDAEDKYRHLNHRHRSLNTCIKISVQHLEADARALLSGLWVFHAPFSAEAAIALFDPEQKNSEGHPSLMHDRLYLLWKRGLLVREVTPINDGIAQFYRLLPTTRNYVESELKQAYEREKLLTQFGVVYSRLAKTLYSQLNKSTLAVKIAQQTREDLTRGMEYVAGVVQSYYLLYYGWILHRLGNPLQGLALLERSMEITQGQNQLLELQAINSMGLVYQDIGRPQEALSLFEQALPMMREAGDRIGEATILNNMGLAYQGIGRPQEALAFYEQALPILREAHDWATEASTLNNIALVYKAIGRPREALAFYERALPVLREVGDRVKEAATLNNIALVYDAIGRPQEALKFYERALLLRREVGDRAGEASTLNNLGAVYRDIGQPREALAFYQQALPIRREVDDHAGEAITLTNMGAVYQTIGRPREALALFEQALPMMREAGDRANEATTLNNIALVFQTIGRPQEALKFYEQALLLRREVGDLTGEATTLTNMAQVYQATAKPQEALKLCEQALPIRRAVGDRAGEAATLNTLGLIYQTTGKAREALAFYEQALPIRHDVGDRAGEAITLGNIAYVHQTIGQPREALAFYEQALPMTRETGDRATEANTLNNMALLYDAIDQSQEALKLCEQALLIRREVGDRAGEAATLSNMGAIYRGTGQPQEALALFQQALPIMREVSNRTGEAVTLTNSALMYQAIGQLQEALQCYEEALPIMREVGDPVREAGALNGLAYLYQRMHNYKEAVKAFEQSIALERQVSHTAGEVTGLVGLALVLYRHLSRLEEAISYMKQASALMMNGRLSQDAAGHTPADLLRILRTMEQEGSHGIQETGPTTIPREVIQRIINNTVAVMTVTQDRRYEWREVMGRMIQHTGQQGNDRQIEIDFLTNVVATLDGQSSSLPPDHPYAQAMGAIKEGIAAGGPSVIEVPDEVIQAVREFVNAEDLETARQVVEAKQALLFQPEVNRLFEEYIAQAKVDGDQHLAETLEFHLTLLRLCKTNGITSTFEHLAEATEIDLPFDDELIMRSIEALVGGPQEKMEHMQYLTTQLAQTADEELKTLISTIQLALFGSDLSQLGQSLRGVYRQAWEVIAEEANAIGDQSA